MVVFALCPVLYFFTGSLRVASTILLTAAYFVIVFAAFRNGGIPAPTLPFLALLPIAAIILIGRNAGLFFIIAVGTGLVWLYLAAEAGRANPSPHDTSQFNVLFVSGMFLVTLAIAYLAFAYQKVAMTTLQRLQNSNNQLAEQTALLSTQEEEIRRQNTELEQFARVASHDLQAPLRQLMMLCGFLEEDLGEGISEEAKRNLASISKVSGRMRQLIKDILDLTRMPADNLELQPVAPAALIPEVISLLPASSGSEAPEFVYDDMPEVMADPVLLQQVYQNLMTNALKFVPEQTKPQVTFTSEIEGEDIILGVRDNGIGIAEEDRSKIFEPLVRLHNRQEYDGTGIGLAICAKAVARMGGKIWAENTPGGGAHFKLSLKRA